MGICSVIQSCDPESVSITNTSEVNFLHIGLRKRTSLRFVVQSNLLRIYWKLKLILQRTLYTTPSALFENISSTLSNAIQSGELLNSISNYAPVFRNVSVTVAINGYSVTTIHTSIPTSMPTFMPTYHKVKADEHQSLTTSYGFIALVSLLIPFLVFIRNRLKRHKKKTSSIFSDGYVVNFDCNQPILDDYFIEVDDKSQKSEIDLTSPNGRRSFIDCFLPKTARNIDDGDFASESEDSSRKSSFDGSNISVSSAFGEDNKAPSEQEISVGMKSNESLLSLTLFEKFSAKDDLESDSQSVDIIDAEFLVPGGYAHYLLVDTDSPVMVEHHIVSQSLGIIDAELLVPGGYAEYVCFEEPSSADQDLVCKAESAVVSAYKETKSYNHEKLRSGNEVENLTEEYKAIKKVVGALMDDLDISNISASTALKLKLKPNLEPIVALKALNGELLMVESEEHHLQEFKSFSKPRNADAPRTSLAALLTESIHKELNIITKHERSSIPRRYSEAKECVTIDSFEDELHPFASGSPNEVNLLLQRTPDSFLRGAGGPKLSSISSPIEDSFVLSVGSSTLLIQEPLFARSTECRTESCDSVESLSVSNAISSLKSKNSPSLHKLEDFTQEWSKFNDSGGSCSPPKFCSEKLGESSDILIASRASSSFNDLALLSIEERKSVHTALKAASSSSPIKICRQSKFVGPNVSSSLTAKSTAKQHITTDFDQSELTTVVGNVERKKNHFESIIKAKAVSPKNMRKQIQCVDRLSKPKQSIYTIAASIATQQSSGYELKSAAKKVPLSSAGASRPNIQETSTLSKSSGGAADKRTFKTAHFFPAAGKADSKKLKNEKES